MARIPMLYRMTPALALLAVIGACKKAGEPATAIGKCGVSATADSDITMPGPFNIGYRTFSITYQPMGEPGPRTIPINIWYPTHDASGTPPVYEGIIPDEQYITGEKVSFTNASLAPPLSSCGYPTIEYSHGDRGLGGGAAYMMRHFASHGWVALAPDHTGDTLSDDDGSMPNMTPIFNERAQDMAQTLDEMGRLATDDPLHDKVATDKVAYVGHSFGTFDAWAVAGTSFDIPLLTSMPPSGPITTGEMAVFTAGQRDPRVLVSTPMAGTIDRSWYGPSGETAVHIPILQMTGGDNNVGQYTAWPTMQNSPMIWIDLAGGCHESFNLGGCATLPTETGYMIARTYEMALARYYVLGDTQNTQIQGILNGTYQVSNLVTFNRR